MENVLVTGGAGYIGSHACKQLKKNGYNPIAYDNLSRGHREMVKWGELIEGDILDTNKVFETLKKFNIRSIMHFAAFAYVGESVTHPNLYYKNNVQGSLSLLEAAVQAGVEKFVFSSTCATYGMPEKTPITEDLPQNPINPYGQTKLIVEKMLKDFSRAFLIKTLCLRYFNAAGADLDGEIGEYHEPETHLIPLTIQAALRNTEIQVFGNDYPTRDGTCIRDYIHVTDLAEAHVLALKYLSSTKDNFSFFNLGTTHGYSVKEIVQTTEEVCGVNIQQNIIERRPGDPAVLVANNDKAKRILGWNPQITDIKKIIESAAKWHKK